MQQSDCSHCNKISGTISIKGRRIVCGQGYRGFSQLAPVIRQYLKDGAWRRKRRLFKVKREMVEELISPHLGLQSLGL